jgi:type III restriction enzyme
MKRQFLAEWVSAVNAHGGFGHWSWDVSFNPGDIKVVQHIWQAIRFENAEQVEPVFDRDRPIRSTGDMGTWYTGKPCERTVRSHINFCVYDSAWEASEAFELDRNAAVEAWAKNDHLGFEILYVSTGA